MSTEWDARAYERVSAPQAEWGRRVLDRIALRGDETALDAGCGSGRVTRMLAERLPRGRVVAVDASAGMVAEATERLADLAPRVTVRRCDLLALDVDEPVDLIVSTATLHWILDHDALFARLFAALRPGGRLVAQCGGEGNVAAAVAAADAVAAGPPYAEALTGMPQGWLFAGPDETTARLAAAGFEDARAWLTDAPARPVGDGVRLPRHRGAAAPRRAPAGRPAPPIRRGGRRAAAGTGRARAAGLRAPQHGGPPAGALRTPFT